MKNRKINYIIMWLFVASVGAFAQTSDLLNDYLKTAAENNPGVRSAFSLYQASLQKVPQAGAWQDPTLEAGFFLQPMELVDGRQVAEFKLMQMFPWFGTRKAARTEMQAMAKMAYEQFRETRDQLWLDVYTQWFTLCRLQQQLKNNQENKKLLEQLETLSLRKFTTGSSTSEALGERQKMQRENTSAGNATQGMNMGGISSIGQSSVTSMSNTQPGMGSMGSASSGMSEVLRIRIEMAEIENNTESILSEIQAEKVKFNSLLNRPAESEVQIPDSLQQIPFLFDIEAIKSQITAQNPMLGMINEEQSAYRAKAAMDRKMGYPMFGIGLQYMLISPPAPQRGESENGGMSGMNSSELPPSGGGGAMGGMDMIMPMVSVSIPIYRGKYKAQQRENAFLQQASKEKYINTQNLLEAELHRLKSDLDNAARKIALYRKQSELAQTTYNLIVSEFSSGKSDLSSIIQVQRQLLDYKLKIAEATADYNTMTANIQKLISSNEK